MVALRDDERLLEALDLEKEPYLFSSEVLMKLLESTSSSKTKLGMLSSISPRLLDPEDKLDQILRLFVSMEEKGQVEECLRRQTQHLKGSVFIKTFPSMLRRGRRSGGRGSLHSREEIRSEEMNYSCGHGAESQVGTPIGLYLDQYQF